jgi:hypothetical protein
VLEETRSDRRHSNTPIKGRSGKISANRHAVELWLPGRLAYGYPVF